jgi:nucleotide-binding universal stress UspA family protein
VRAIEMRPSLPRPFLMVADDRLYPQIHLAIMKILAATDLSLPADEAIRQAHEWAASIDAALIICHVLSPANPPPAGADTVARRVAHLTGRASGEFRVELETGTASAAIRRKAKQLAVDLIVVGRRGAAPLHRFFMGSVSRHVVERAHCSVLVAQAHPRTAEVLVATDLSDPSVPAITAGASEARRRRANLTVIHNFDVWSASAPPEAGSRGVVNGRVSS